MFALQLIAEYQRERQARARADTAGDKTYKVNLDGYNELPYLSGQSEKSARREVF